MSNATNKLERYLGDGVYATFDGYTLCLDLRGQDDTTRIYLEPSVFRALVRFEYDLHHGELAEVEA